ncbi:hypothetical protein CBS147321_10995 [Aspergillus niger]|nr:hypothetical protein CBS12448_10879 [Aspergillus niger]KAI2868279.1 hypothetical protein CBS11852_11369 [Aspergillus niger]KAI2928633.1 hypothetical protein CBS147321_10995 [Aspergillus niger]KAI2937276.1 hypothetical protein CBS147322_10904 [Aspergillus niger]KAI2989174.1 hypothetical protein CBS147345_10641 [Aspergillus niger]
MPDNEQSSGEVEKLGPGRYLMESDVQITSKGLVQIILHESTHQRNVKLTLDETATAAAGSHIEVFIGSALLRRL